MQKSTAGKFHGPPPDDGRDRKFPTHSALMLAARITLAHLSVSSMTSLVNSPGETTSTEPPRSPMRPLITGSARPLFTSLLRISIVAAGVSFGTPKPSHPL